MNTTTTDVAVLLIFFTRTETLLRTFEVIRMARPTHLLLYQDGPRNAEDVQKLKTARRIVADEAIDWQCDVLRSYHKENSGAWASNSASSFQSQITDGIAEIQLGVLEVQLGIAEVQLGVPEVQLGIAEVQLGVYLYHPLYPWST